MTGLAQKWALEATVSSAAEEPLMIQEVELVSLEVSGGASCIITRVTSISDAALSPGESQECAFVLDLSKASLEDRRSSSLDLSLQIKWRRKPAGAEETDSHEITAQLAVPGLLIPSAEPRVLASAQSSSQSSSSTPSSLIHLDYTLEKSDDAFPHIRSDDGGERRFRLQRLQVRSGPSAADQQTDGEI